MKLNVPPQHTSSITWLLTLTAQDSLTRSLALKKCFRLCYQTGFPQPCSVVILTPYRKIHSFTKIGHSSQGQHPDRNLVRTLLRDQLPRHLLFLMVSDTTITFVLLCGYNTSQRFATSHCVVPKLLSHCSNTQTWRWSSQQLLLQKFSHHSVFHVQRTDVRAWLPQVVLLTLPFNVMIQTYLGIKHFQLSWRLACPRHLP